jgi:hypothetical protein
MKQKPGELVSHDVYTCLLCRNATGCMEVDGMDPEQKLELEETPSDEGMELSINVVDGIGEPEKSKAAAHETLSNHGEEGMEIPLDDLAPPQHHEPKLAAQETVSDDDEEGREMPLDELAHHLSLKEHNMQ